MPPTLHNEVTRQNSTASLNVPVDLPTGLTLGRRLHCLVRISSGTTATTVTTHTGWDRIGSDAATSNGSAAILVRTVDASDVANAGGTGVYTFTMDQSFGTAVVVTEVSGADLPTSSECTLTHTAASGGVYTMPQMTAEDTALLLYTASSNQAPTYTWGEPPFEYHEDNSGTSRTVGGAWRVMSGTGTSPATTVTCSVAVGGQVSLVVFNPDASAPSAPTNLAVTGYTE